MHYKIIHKNMLEIKIRCGSNSSNSHQTYPKIDKFELIQHTHIVTSQLRRSLSLLYSYTW